MGELTEITYRVGIARARNFSPMLGYDVPGDAAFTLILHPDGSVTWEWGDTTKPPVPTREGEG